MTTDPRDTLPPEARRASMWRRYLRFWGTRVVDAVLLNPLPYREAERVVMLWRSQAATGIMMAPTPAMLAVWRQGSHSLEAIEAYRPADATLLGRGDAAVVHTAAVGEGFLR